MGTGLLDIPKKLLPLVTEFNNFRYFLLEGGRGGGKSQTIARFILMLGEKYDLRIVCGRETQNSISESVYSLFADLIRTYNLAYEVYSTKIVHKTSGTQINFRGFREQGAFNIQGMEGVDILWIDESQAITKQTLDVLIPTIRKETAKVIFSMNRHVVDDPVFKMFDRRSDCLHITINYVDNPYCTSALQREAEECKKVSQEDYDHIWMGVPLDKSEDAVYTYSELEYARTNKYPCKQGYGKRLAGFDIARFGDDKCACVIIQQMGALQWEEVVTDEWSGKDLNYTTGRILDMINTHRIDFAIIDEDGLGSGPLDTLIHGRNLNNISGFRNPTISYSDNKDYANPRTDAAYKLKKLLMDQHICLNDDGLIKELMSIKYTYDHQQRKILISKKQMKEKFKIKSPNRADALIYAVSLIDNTQDKDERDYYRPIQSQYKEEDLYSIAGIR